MDALSSTTRVFLESIGIDSADHFLGTKTSSISRQYIEWRDQEQMPPLKGYGAIATVSGWKAQIRKAATDAGNFDLAAVAPEDRYTKSTSPTPPPTQQEVEFSLPAEVGKNLYCRHNQLLLGLPARTFSLRCPNGKYNAIL